MAKSMAEKQWDAAYKVAGVAIENELYIYETVSDLWIRLVNSSEFIPTESWMNLYKAKGFEVKAVSDIAFLVSAPFKVGA